MPSAVPKHIVNVYRHASHLPPQVWEAFRRRERDSNVMYPHALRACSIEGGEDVQLWMTCSTFHVAATGEPQLDLVLSCTEGVLGSYPLFIFANTPFDDLGDDFIRPRLDAIIQGLLNHVHPSRVFSVFAPEPVTRAFAALWSCYTNIRPYQEPYYSAKLTYCTKSSLTRRQMTFFADLFYVPRLACDSDILVIAELCQGFAMTSEPFVLTPRAALKEARYLVRHRLVWVLEVNRPGEPSDIASIVAVTRSSANVAGITKVFTNPRWRKRGCAERLVRFVCQQLLLVSHFADVVLYVAHDNAAAAGVYRRVGFQGLSDSKIYVEGVDNWLELGFDRTLVRLGHW
ncbi:hypothetical protein K488DRAFT_79073 [Vararia minispora EC-137]|uniref:Uncharacterized protein n=1 Tax=Vararia minispora EC-137 TaxID=1314806 RepID=A0ACB8QIC6_9AGAM|nr:hypothetical protein K488DRAFT_79073 [Vararia minispora EC-137]